ncbi:uncharacterized protein RSE6_03150 [Rhynchosporium secalis]|uniref:Uncharacterized protein n=1 Tax=Rhynchosporium secalis TaxID=38038 RepID=A0A1E1M220_RHYSE|nr:uncharacterized protein RSE6_03150 [Rhynchosporium secalis]
MSDAESGIPKACFALNPVCWIGFIVWQRSGS